MNSLTEFQSVLSDAKELLLAPAVAHPEEATPDLERAVEALNRLRQHLAAETTHLTPSSLVQLKRDLREVNALAAQAGGFYLGCAVILESLTRVYTPQGAAGTLPGRPSLSLEG